MKYSKQSAVLLAAAILIQLAIPGVFIAEKNRILREGTEYRIRVQWLDFEDNGIELSYEIQNNWDNDEMRYAVPENEYEGVYRNLRLTKEPPADGPYMQSASVRRFESPIGEYTLFNADEKALRERWNELLNQGHYCVASVTIRNGKALLTGVFLDDGTPIEDAFR